jgi:archaemetzincin
MAHCVHPNLRLAPSAHASSCGFTCLPAQKRKAATTPSGRIKIWTHQDEAQEELWASTFPGPLVLPRDDLSYDPDAPPQSLLSWKREKDRNEVTNERKTIYVAGLPAIAVEGMESWSRPVGPKGVVQHASTEDVIGYLAAFYHGMPVKPLPNAFSFDTWDSPSDGSAPKTPAYIGISRNNGSTRIRTRACPDGLFSRQLNLNDLLDACIDNLPSDAYSLMLLVEQDIYENDEDDFCCGRAYGGSRIGVVSSARYNPLLDQAQKVEREHAWPASHCAAYVDECCSRADSAPEPSSKVKGKGEALPDAQAAPDTSPLRAAVTAHTALPSLRASPTPRTLAGLWLGRLCRTASHELGHCAGMDHCVYYACAMQSTASVCEDARQPLYLCPVDLAKMLKATGAGEVERYEALRAYCADRQDVHLFAAFGAWLDGHLRNLR